MIGLTLALMIATTQSACPLTSQWSTLRQMPPGDRNVVMIVDAHAFWNNVPVDRTTLDQYVEAVSAMRPPPVMILEVAAARDCATQRAFADRIVSQGGCAPRRCFISYRPISRRERSIPPPAPSM